MPFAGGGIWAYREWSRRLPAWVAVCGIELPGRGRMISKPAMSDGEALLKAMLASVGDEIAAMPTVLLGHSMGALLAHGCARKLMETRGIGAAAVVVCGQRPPHLPARRPPICDLPNDELLQELRQMTGGEIEGLDHPELAELMMPTLRADITLVERWPRHPPQPLPIPLHAFGGEDDPDVLPDDLEAWRPHTSAAFSTVLFPGGHFFTRTSETALLKAIEPVLEAALP